MITPTLSCSGWPGHGRQWRYLHVVWLVVLAGAAAAAGCGGHAADGSKAPEGMPATSPVPPPGPSAAVSFVPVDRGGWQFDYVDARADVPTDHVAFAGYDDLMRGA